MNIYSIKQGKLFRHIMPFKQKTFNRKENLNLNFNNRINSELLVSPSSTNHQNRVINIKYQNNPLMHTLDSVGQSNINRFIKRSSNIFPNRKYYKTNNTSNDTFNFIHKNNHSLVNLEYEFNLLKNKIIELNNIYSPQRKIVSNHKENKRYKVYNLHKNISQAENKLKLMETYDNFNRTEKSETPINNNINNYLFINNKFRYNETDSNEYMNSPQNNIFKLKINDYFRTIKKINKGINNGNNNENVEDENTEENDEELSELASRIVKTSESIHNDRKIMNNNKINNYYNKGKKKLNEEKNQNEILLNKYNEENFGKKIKDNYSVNTVNSIFILNKHGKNSEKDIDIKSPNIGNNRKYDFSIEKLNVEINSKTNSNYYENKKVLNSIDNLKSFNKYKNNFYKIKTNIKLVPSDKVQINLSPKNKKPFKTIDNYKLNKNDKKRKVKFDARILTIYYNQEDKVPNLSIKDNKNQNVEFVPLDMTQYLALLTSNAKLKSSIISKNSKFKIFKFNLSKKNSKMLSSNLKKLKMNKRKITPDIKYKLKSKLVSIKKENNLKSFSEKDSNITKITSIKIGSKKSRNKLENQKIKSFNNSMKENI